MISNAYKNNINFDKLCAQALIKEEIPSAKVDHIEHICCYFLINIIKH